MQQLLNRIVPGVVAFTLLLFLQQVVAVPRQVYAIGLISIVVLGLGVWQLAERRLLSEKFWRFMLTPILFFVSSVLFLSFLEHAFLKQLLLLVVVLLIWVYLEVLYLWFHFRPRYQVHSLENISSYLDLLTIFFTASSFLSISVFLGLSVWYLVPVFAMITGLVTYQLIWTSGAAFRSGLPYVLTIGLVATELFIAVSFLPTTAYVSGLAVGLPYYVMAGVSRNWLMGVREAAVVRRYLIIGMFGLLLVFATAKWF